MDNSQDKQEGGHEAELGRASTRMADAITAGDAAALRGAASDHAAALGSQATAMAASIAKPVYGKLAEIMALLQTQAQQSETQARLARDHADKQANISRSWLGDESKRRDAQADRLYAELDELKALTKDVQSSASEIAARLKKHDEDIRGILAVQNDHAERIDLIDSLSAWRTGVDERIAGIEQADRDDLRAEIKDIKSALAQYEQKHQELIKRLGNHGDGE